MPRCTIFRSNSVDFYRTWTSFPPQADLSVDCSGYYFRPFKFSLMERKNTWSCDLKRCCNLAWYCSLSGATAICRLAASSFPLLSTVPCTYHFTKGRSCIFTERPFIYIAPPPSTHQPLALLFCTTGRSCIFAERSHYIFILISAEKPPHTHISAE